MRNRARAFVLILSFAILIACRAEDPAAHELWSSFISRPGNGPLARIELAVESCKGTLDCREGLQPSSPEVSALVALIESGNREALAAGFLAVQTLPFSGGNLEDVTAAVAGQLTRDPVYFSTLLRNSPRDPNLLIAVSIDVQPDNEDFRREEIDRRIEALQSVTDPTLQEVKSWALGVLEGHRSSASSP